MILIPHEIVGAAITNIFPDHPVFGFSLALASHYALDMIPHSDYDIGGFIDTDAKTVKSIFRNTKAYFDMIFVGFDIFLGGLLSFLFFVRDEKTLYLTLLGIIAGILPDFLQFVYLKWKVQPWIFFQKIHDMFHSPNKMKENIVLGYVLQVLTVALCVGGYFLLK